MQSISLKKDMRSQAKVAFDTNDEKITKKEQKLNVKSIKQFAFDKRSKYQITNKSKCDTKNKTLS
jgi:hypothetical protein